MKKFLQKSCHWLVMLIAWFAVSATAWAEEKTVTFDMYSFAWDYPNGYTSTKDGIYAGFTSGGGGGYAGQFNLYGSGSGKLNINSEVGNITRVEMECVAWGGSTPSNEYAIKVCEWDGLDCDFTPMTTNGAIAIWQGTPKSTLCLTAGNGGDIDVRSLKITYIPLPAVDYHVNINVVGTLPVGFTPTVTVDGKTFTENGTYSTPKTLTTNSISATTPENGDWYYEVTYDVENDHTFTVTYKEYNHYTVSVTGCDDESAGVDYDSRTYHNGNKINVKETLVAENLTVVYVNGYVAGTAVVGTLDGHNATITAPYTEADIIPYTVTITGMPEGASVMIEDEEFLASGTHNSRKTLDYRNASVKNCPETHYTNDANQWYDSETKTFNIVFSPYLVYTVAVDEASAYKGEEAGVKVYNYKTYLPGQNIYSKTELSENDVMAIDVDGFTGTVTLTGNVFTVSYTKNDFILFRASDYFNGSYGQVDDTKEGVSLYTWSSGGYFNIGKLNESHLALTSADVPIVKVEFEYKTWGSPYSYGLLDRCNTGSYSSNTWEGSSKDLHLYANGESAYIEYIKVYLAKPTTYTINITGMPEGEDYYVVVNYDNTNGKFTTNGEHKYTTTNELNEYNVNCFYPNNPQTHKVSKTYDADTNTFNVTFTAFAQYNVVADADNEYTGDGNGVRVKFADYDWRNKSIGDTFYFDGTLAESDIVMRNVDGYTGSFVLDNTAEPKTITVKYVENEPQTYTVVFAGEEVPEGASVTITDAEGEHVFNSTDADKTFVSKYTYNDEAIAPAQFEFYETSVAVEGTTITVTYTKVDYIYVDLSKAPNTQDVITRTSATGTVSVDFNQYGNKANLYSGWPITVNLYSVEYDIEKIEYVIDDTYSSIKKSGTQFNFGSWTTSYEVWEAMYNDTPVQTKSVKLSVPSDASTDILYNAVKVWVKEALPIDHFAMSDAEWATLCIYKDFTVPEGYEAYTVGALVDDVPTFAEVKEEKEEIILTEITNVPAGTPILLHGPAAESVDLYAPATKPASVVVNYLVGNPADYAQTFYAGGVADNGFGKLNTDTWEYEYGTIGTCQLYQLANENNLVGFYRQVEDGSTLQCAAHKAFLAVPTTQAESNARFLLPGQEVITGIDSVIATEAAENIFNLQGQRVVAPAKGGVYVKNGKKIIVK